MIKFLHVSVQLNSFISGNNPEECEEDFPSIVQCMADGRDLLPCCLNQGIPQVEKYNFAVKKAK